MKQKTSIENERTKELIALVRKGDSQAFSALVDAYNPLLKKILFLYTTDDMSEADVEDLGQEELIAFYRAILSFDFEQSEVEFGLYAKICVTNSMISYKRAARRKSGEIAFVESSELDLISDPDGEPAKIFEQKESERILGEQIEKTLAQYENEVWGYYVNGYSSKEIASKLNSGEKSIENAIFRIRRKLKTLLGFYK